MHPVGDHRVHLIEAIINLLMETKTHRRFITLNGPQLETTMYPPPPPPTT